MSMESTKVRALREARGLMQTFGFNGFSLQTLAENLGIKKPSLFEHFKSKEDLGKEVLEHYQASFNTWIETVSVFEPDARIGALFEIFCKFSTNQAMLCPLAAMIADYNALPKAMRDTLPKLFDFQYRWLKNVIEEGQKKKMFRKNQPSSELADLVLALALGAQLSARVQDDPRKIRQLKAQALAFLAVKGR